jgi:vancomycin resistance protein YoaR
MKKSINKKLFLGLDLFLFLLIFLLTAYLVFEKTFDNSIYPNVYLGENNLAGMNFEEAESFIDKKIEKFEDNGFIISFMEREMVWRNTVPSFDLDLVSRAVLFNTNKTVSNAYSVGKSGNVSDLRKKISTIFSPTYIELDFMLDKDLSLSVINKNFEDLIQEPKDAALLWEKDEESGEIIFLIEEEVFGETIDYNDFFDNLKENIKFLKNDKIELKAKNENPKITKDDISVLIADIDEIIEKAPFDIYYEKEDAFFSVSKEVLASWIYVKKDPADLDLERFKLSIKEDLVSDFFIEEISPQVKKDPVKPFLEFDGEKVVVFEPGLDGVRINLEESFFNIKSFLFSNNIEQEDIEIEYVELVTEIDFIEKIGDVNDLGIKEIIGFGHSNFAGSPANRIHNIKVGTNKISGTIVAPGEEFSTVATIGRVNRETGYLPELVIKGNRTVPEYGGGLCQVSTTMFRTALGAGLPVTERRNHSYRVSYYEPAGTDAAIYNPRPDLRFKNDTDNNILIQARFEGPHDLYFDIWGTSDGRISTTTDPVIYNIIRPGPTQIIETTELPVGKRECTERAVSGADAYFDYKVIYNPGSEEEKIVETRFHSKYVPWREVCLVGVDPNKNKEELESDSQNETSDDETLEN